MNTIPTKILIIEDNQVVLDTLSEGLRYKGFDVQSYTDPVEGLKQFFTFEPDIVITDLRMPEMDGNQIASTIKKSKNHAPRVVCITGNVADAIPENFDIVMQKPVSLSEIINGLECNRDAFGFI